MKLKEFLPESNNAALSVYEGGFLSFLKSSVRDTTKINPVGVEQLYFDWLRTAYSYRRMFIQDLYLLAFDVTEVRTALLCLKKEIFRKGFDEWIPKFINKCPKCGQEFQEERETCNKCFETEKIIGGYEIQKDMENLDDNGNPVIVEKPYYEYKYKLDENKKKIPVKTVTPDLEQTKRFEEVKLKCNEFNQSVEDVLRMCLDDIGIVDDAFLLLNKIYIFDGTKLSFSKTEEVRRIHPALVEFDLDKNGLPKNSHWFCFDHRGEVRTEPGACILCGKETFPAMYIYNHRGTRLYYTEDEIIHWSKYSENETYGYSVLLSVMQKILTLSGMDRFLYKYFFERKTPTGIILTYTDDPNSLQVAKDTVESKMMEDPTYTPWVAVSTKSGRGRTDYVKLFHTLQEMEYIPVRDEIRDRVAAVYGVPQAYFNVMEGMGGISGSTQQLRLFSLTIEDHQRVYNEKVLPKILAAFGVTDWEIKLRTPEEKTEQSQLQITEQKIQIVNALFQMGFDIKLQKNKGKSLIDLDFSVSGNAKRPEQMGMGGMPGLPINAQGGKSLAQLPSGASGEDLKQKPNPDEVEKILAEFKKPKKVKQEEDVFNENEIKSLDSREDSEKSLYENQVFNEHS